MKRGLSSYHKRRRARQAARGKCGDCNKAALGFLCVSCGELSNKRKRERRELFLRMRDLVMVLAAEGRSEAIELARDLPAARSPRRVPA